MSNTPNPNDVRALADAADSLDMLADGYRVAIGNSLRAYATLLDGVNHVLGTCDSDIVAFSKTVDFGDDIRRRCFVEFKRRLVQLLPAPPASTGKETA